MCHSLAAPSFSLGLILSPSKGKLQDRLHFNRITEIRPDTNGISCRGKCLSISHTHAHLHVNSGESVWWGKCVCMYMCVHQSEPVAISPPVCAWSLSFTLTHLSASACPHHRHNPIRLKIMTRGTLAHRLVWLLMALFLFETLSSPLVPSFLHFFSPLFPYICYGVRKTPSPLPVHRLAEGRGMSWRTNGLCDICLPQCVWYQPVGRDASLLTVHSDPFTTSSWLGVISGSVRREEWAVCHHRAFSYGWSSALLLFVVQRCVNRASYDQRVVWGASFGTQKFVLIIHP